MIRQAINCDMCGTERVEPTSHWFVADEVGGELRLRGWESPKGVRKKMKHLCGQKCVQRLMDNFTASIMAGLQGRQQTKEMPAAPVVPAEKRESFSAPVRERDDMPILERMGYDRETIAMVEAESWAGTARPKDSWGASETSATEQQDLMNTARGKSPTVRPFQRPA